MIEDKFMKQQKPIKLKKLEKKVISPKRGSPLRKQVKQPEPIKEEKQEVNQEAEEVEEGQGEFDEPVVEKQSPEGILTIHEAEEGKQDTRIVQE